MTMTRPIPTTPIVRPERRGIALLLVMVTLATATVLTTSFLISRENSPDIGLMAERRVTSEWSAKSASELAIAVMQTEADWRAIANSGLLIDSMSYLGADVNVAVTDLEGGTVEDDERHVVLTVMATVDGVETVTQRILAVRPDGTYEDALDPELREFGVFAVDRLDIESGSQIGVWPLSPIARAGDGGKIGLGFDSSSGFSAGSSSIARSTKVFLPPEPSLSLESSVTSQGVTAQELPVEAWTTTADRPDSMSGLVNVTAGLPIPITINVDNVTVPGGRYIERLTVEDADVTLDATYGPIFVDLKEISGQALYLDGATVRVKGDMEIMALDDVRIEDTAIILEEGATLTIYLGEDLHIDGSVINADVGLMSDSDRMGDDLTAWSDPRRVRFVQLSESGPAAQREANIRDHSIVVASMHTPLSQVRVDGKSTIAGRVGGRTMSVRDDSAVLLDPIFDNKLGLTEKSSPLYDENGDPLPGLKEALKSVSSSEGFASAMSRILAALPSPPAPAPKAGDAGEPTPRFGDRVSTMRDWPVLVRVQESAGGETPQDAIFVAIENNAIAEKLGSTVSKASGALPAKTPVKSGKAPSVGDVLSATFEGDDDGG